MSEMPKTQTTMYIEYKSEADKKTYSGDFTFKRLNIGEIAQVGVETSRLNGGLVVDDNTDYINTMLATMKLSVVKAPEWWKPADLYDIAAVITVYKKYMEYERSFRPSLPEGDAGAPAGSAEPSTK